VLSLFGTTYHSNSYDKNPQTHHYYPTHTSPDSIIIMNKVFATLLLGLSLISAPSWGADFDKGLAAAQSGDFETALREWTPLAKQGHVQAQYNLALMYDNGEGVPQDYKTAVKWYTLAAEKGDADAQYNLGVMYRKGDGVLQDDKTAVKWYTLAAEQGNADAQYNLGQMYRKGEGVPQDDKTAVKWYTLAAEKGDADAQYNLGVMYVNGNGVIQDNAYAHMWWNIAASNGDKDAGKNRQTVAKEMTPSQLEKAQDLARECVAKKYKGC
jgi:uncharacterized protein